MLRTALAALTLLTLLASSTAAQNPQRLSNMVFVNATVTGAKNEAARGLRPEHFQIWEDNIEQKVEYFSAEDTPWTFGIVLAVSGLLPGRADQTSTSIRDAVVAFRQTGNANNKYIVDELPFGSDGIYHSITVGLQELSREPNPRKALIVIVDGFDTTQGDPGHPLIEFAKKLNIPVYLMFVRDGSSGKSLGLADVAKGDQYWLANGRVYEELTSTTGGHMSTADALYELGAICKKLAEELRGQYVLGYVSTNDAKSDKWRKLKVTVNPPKDFPKVKVQTKGRYFASKK
jgi:Ca-activated chloride channel homolog